MAAPSDLIKINAPFGWEWETDGKREGKVSENDDDDDDDGGGMSGDREEAQKKYHWSLGKSVEVECNILTRGI